MNLADYRIEGKAIEFVESTHVDRLSKRVNSLSYLCIFLFLMLCSVTIGKSPVCSPSYSDDDRAAMNDLVFKFVDSER